MTGFSPTRTLRAEHIMPVTAGHVGGWDFSGINSQVTVTGAGIFSISGASGNGNAFSQGNDANKPQYNTRTVNGLDVAEYPSAFPTGATLIGPNQAAWDGWANVGDGPYTLIQVCVMDVVTNGKRIGLIFNNGVTFTDLLINGTSWSHSYVSTGPATTQLDHSVAVAGELALLVATNDGAGNITFNVNNGTPVMASDGVDSGRDSNSNALGSSNPDGLLCEAHVFDVALGVAELANWREYLGRWGTFGAAA